MAATGATAGAVGLAGCVGAAVAVGGADLESQPDTVPQVTRKRSCSSPQLGLFTASAPGLVRGASGPQILTAVVFNIRTFILLIFDATMDHILPSRGTH
jgi:hypothetical protein